MNFALAMLLALVLEAAFGWPDWLHGRIGHPVGWIGALIAALDRRFNRGAARRARGVFTALLVIGVAGAAGLAIQAVLPESLTGTFLLGVLAWPLVAARSLHDHVAAVARPLARGDPPAARRAVAMIVGRDPTRLDEGGIARAGLESLAENASDGVIAPLFWGALFGLPGMAAYKAVNTLDSMIGHRTPRHEAFGWASARIDDLANLIPARLTGLLIAVAGRRPRAALACMLRDAAAHRSPNAGWPEAAMAGALAVRLSGPRVYANHVAEEPWLNAGSADPGPREMEAGLAVFIRAMIVAGLMLAGLAVALA